jgi:hypothetical protein
MPRPTSATATASTIGSVKGRNRGPGAVGLPPTEPASDDAPAEVGGWPSEDPGGSVPAELGDPSSVRPGGRVLVGRAGLMPVEPAVPVAVGLGDPASVRPGGALSRPKRVNRAKRFDVGPGPVEAPLRAEGWPVGARADPGISAMRRGAVAGYATSLPAR